MLGRAPQRPRSARSEAEKPFWISFSDLMTALMVLFLVAMTVALLAITKEISESERQKSGRAEEIERLLARLREASREVPGIQIRGPVIDFGERARFDTNSHRLNDNQSRLLREFVPRVLALAGQPEGQRWLKRVAVEGYADQRGSYLYNLNLSLQRSQRVLCSLLTTTATGHALSEAERQQVKDLFVVSGVSYNAQKASPEESRRIELRLEFLELAEPRPASGPASVTTPAAAPAATPDSRCPLDAP